VAGHRARCHRCWCAGCVCGGGAMIEGFISSLVLAAAGFLGWVMAHNNIAYECKQLGGFYVGNTVYECNVKGETK